MIDRLDRLATGRHVVIAFLASFGALVAANVFATLFYSATGGYGILDLAGARNALDPQSAYTAERAYALMTAWGPVGRRNQVLFTATGDVVLPLVTFAFGALALLYATRRLGAPAWLRTALLALPAAYLACDYLENLGIVTLVLTYPGRLDALAATTERLREAKTATSSLALLAAFGALALGWVRGRRAGRSGT
jgi:hypothetical protein